MMWEVLYRYFPAVRHTGIAVATINDPSNGITLTDFAHKEFAKCHCALKKTVRTEMDAYLTANEARQTEKISHDDFQREIKPFLKSCRSSSSTIHVLKAQRPLIIEDIDEEVSAKRRKVY